jgi:hypothetical protein
MNYTVHASSDDPELWHQIRSTVVTATDLSRLANGGPATWNAIKAEKAGHRTFQGNQYTDHGIAREPVIARWAAAELALTRNTNFLISTQDERFGATPDLINMDDSLVGDIKTAKAPVWDAPPQKYIDQLQMQMYTVGAQGAYLIVEFHEDFIPTEMEPTVYVVDRDEDRIAELIEIGEQFISMNEPSILDIYLHDYAIGAQREAAGKAEKEAAKELIEKEIAEAPNFTKHVSGAGSISRGKDTVKDVIVFDEETFKRENPDLWAKYAREETKKTKGRLSVTPAKDAA